MHPITRRTALAGTATAASTAILASCSGGGEDEPATQSKIDNPDENINTEGMPIVEEETTITFMTGRPSMTAEDWNEVSVAKEFEEESNIHVEWGLVPDDGIEEKRNLALASGDYPEVFYRAGFGAGDIAKYGAQGVFVPLDDLIDQYMPNFSAILENSPEIRTGLTQPDGKIYSLPVIWDSSFISLRYMYKLWLREDWLSDFGMSTPETLDDFEAYLEEVVGTKDGAIGLGDTGELLTVDSCLLGTFEIGNKGTSVGRFDLDPETEKVRFFPTSDGFRDMLEYYQRLYTKGLIMEDAFSVDAAQFDGLGREGKVGATAYQTTSGFFGEEGENYIALPPLKRDGSSDVPAWHAVNSELAGIGPFVMTDKCEHPIEIARWMDHWYSDEGSRGYFMGVEGVSYEEIDGRYELLPEILEGDKSLDEALEPHALFMGGGYPARAAEEWFRGVENTPQAIEGSEVVEPYALEEVWSPFTFTEEESQMLTSIGQDITKHVEESRAAFITGKRDMSQWDDYVAQFEQMGVEEYIGAYQAAYERRQEA